MNLTPDIYVKNYYDITPETIKNLGCKALFIDLDGTLVSKNTKTPTKEVENWLNLMKAAGFDVIILSNNNELRVHNFSKDLGVRYFYRALKPSTIGFKKAFLKVNAQYTKKDVVMIGDQIFTDTLSARIFWAKSIYVEPIDQNNAYVKFRTNITEKPFLRKIKESI